MSLCRMITALCALSFAGFAQPAQTVTVDASTIVGSIDYTRYSLGQGGLSSHPMFHDHLAQVTALHPRYVRFFMQEYYDLYPAHNTYNWVNLDSTLDDIVATGAQPIADICFKPRVLYPVINPAITIPNSWAEWDTLICQLVRHCKQKKYGIHYWEIGNEADKGEDGGCPYQSTTSDFRQWYAHTAKAIMATDTSARVGGPGVSGIGNSYGPDLLSFCNAGGAPLHFFTWHKYDNDPANFGNEINTVKGWLQNYTSLKNIEIMFTEWNRGWADGNPYTNPLFVCMTTKTFQERGLSVGSFYHIQDFCCSQPEFAQFMTSAGATNMQNFWCGGGPYFGLFRNQANNRVMRPEYYSFLWMSRMQGSLLKVTGSSADIACIPVKNGNDMHALLWNSNGWPNTGTAGTTYRVTVNLPATAGGTFVAMRLVADSSAKFVDTVRTGAMASLATNPLVMTLKKFQLGYVAVSSMTKTIVSPMQDKKQGLLLLRGNTLSIIAPPAGRYRVTILDCMGRCVLRSSGTGRTDIDLSRRHLLPGVYAAELQTVSGRQSRTITLTL